MKKKIPDRIFDLNQTYGIITVSGKKAATFLQGQLSNDIYALKPGSYQWSAYCNLKGRIRALLRVWLCDDNYCLLLPKSILPQTLKILKHYGRFSKIMIEDKSTDFFITGFVQPDAVILHSLAAGGAQLLLLPDAMHRFICVGSNPLSNVGADLCVGPASIGVNPDVDPIYQENMTEWQALDIRAGIPEIFPETIELFLPHAIGLPGLGAISFSKGCFCGQEVIARMEYRSTPKRGLAYVEMEAYKDPLPTPGTLIYAEPQTAQTMGTVINATHLETLEMLIEIQKDRTQNENLMLRADTEVGPYRLHAKKTFF